MDGGTQDGGRVRGGRGAANGGGADWRGDETEQRRVGDEKRRRRRRRRRTVPKIIISLNEIRGVAPWQGVWPDDLKNKHSTNTGERVHKSHDHGGPGFFDLGLALYPFQRIRFIRLVEHFDKPAPTHASVKAKNQSKNAKNKMV